MPRLWSPTWAQARSAAGAESSGRAGLRLAPALGGRKRGDGLATRQGGPVGGPAVRRNLAPAGWGAPGAPRCAGADGRVVSFPTCRTRAGAAARTPSSATGSLPTFVTSQRAPRTGTRCQTPAAEPPPRTWCGPCSATALGPRARHALLQARQVSPERPPRGGREGTAGAAWACRCPCSRQEHAGQTLRAPSARPAMPSPRAALPPQLSPTRRPLPHRVVPPPPRGPSPTPQPRPHRVSLGFLLWTLYRRGITRGVSCCDPEPCSLWELGAFFSAA